MSADGRRRHRPLRLLLGAWGPCPDPPAGCIADLDCDDTVGGADTAILLGVWGDCPVGASDGGGGGDGSLTLEEALALMDYESVDEFVTWLLSADTNEAFESVQYLHSLLTE